MSISRAALAAALVEYDNDDLPQHLQRNHRQSALFNFLKPQNRPPPQLPPPELISRHSQSYYSQPLNDGAGPSEMDDRFIRAQRYDTETAIFTGRRSGDWSTERPGSSMTLREDSTIETRNLDVRDWELPSHLLSPEALTPQTPLFPSSSNLSPSLRPELQPIQTKNAGTPVPQPITSPLQSRALSIHLENTASLSAIALDSRRRSVSFDLNQETRRRRVKSEHFEKPIESEEDPYEGSRIMPRPKSVMGLPRDHSEIRNRRISNPVMVRLPKSPPMSALRPSSSMSMNKSISFELHGQPFDTATAHQKEEEEDVEIENEPNPFALPPLPDSHASRFDPKSRPGSKLSLRPLAQSDPQEPEPEIVESPRIRKISEQNIETLNKLIGHTPPSIISHTGDDYLHIDRPTYDDIPDSRSFGKLLIPSKYAKRPTTNRNSSRPKTLIMPSSLLGSNLPPMEKPVRAGFMLGEKPSPVGAKSSILIGNRNGDVVVDPRLFGRGLSDEIKGQMEEDEREKMEGMMQEEGTRKLKERKPGKLYGTSLMDQLEARKQWQKNKQRVFTGDSRPAMMVRSHLSQSHFPITSPTKSTSDPISPSKSIPNLPSSSLRPPLLQFDENDPSPSQAQATRDDDGAPRLIKSKSVFGVDEIWEREMAKLKIIQAEEERLRVENEEKERIKKEHEEEKVKRKKRRGKGKAVEPTSPSKEKIPYGYNQQEVLEERRVSRDVSPIRYSADLPPVLSFSPDREPVSLESRSPDKGFFEKRPASRQDLTGWDSDEDRSKQRSTGSIPVQPSEPYRLPLLNSDSEDEIPLSRITATTTAPRINIPDGDDSSDEDVPLSRLTIQKKIDLPVLNSDISGSLGLDVPALPNSASPRPPSTTAFPDLPSLSILNINNAAINENEEDDEIPLGIRQSRMFPNSSTIQHLQGQLERSDKEKEEIEDDLPLGFKHANAFNNQRSVSMNFNPEYGQSPSYFSPQSFPQQVGYPFPPMPNLPSMGHMSFYGQPQMSYMSPGIPGLPHSISMGGLPQMGLPMPGFPPMPIKGLGIPQEQPAANIDSWRQGVRAPSTVGGSSTR